MTGPEVLDYLERLGARFGAGPAYRRLSSALVGTCEKNARYLKISEYESSLPLTSEVKARFVHYIVYRPGPDRRKVGLLYSGRALELMRQAGFAEGATDFLTELIRRIEASGLAFPPTIVSAEWGFRRPAVEKITVYFCFRRMSAALAGLLAGAYGRKDAGRILAAGRHLTFFGADFSPAGPVSFKLYRKYRGGRGLRRGEREFLERNRVRGMTHYVRVTRLFPDGRTREDERTHFVLKRSAAPFRLPAAGAALLGEFGISAGLKNVVSMDRRGRLAEVYFS